MTTPQIRIIDGDTVTDRDMTENELAAYTAMQDAAATRALADAEKAAAKQTFRGFIGAIATITA